MAIDYNALNEYQQTPHIDNPQCIVSLKYVHLVLFLHYRKYQMYRWCFY